MRVRRDTYRPGRRGIRQEDVPRDDPAEDEADIHDLLLNWGAWCVHRQAQGKAGSAEGNFRPPAQKIFNPPEPGRKVDIPKAIEVNEAMLGVPVHHRQSLHLRYYLGMPDPAICRTLSLPPSGYQRWMRDARLFLRASLQARKSAL